MPLKPEKQERTYQQFVVEVCKAPNAVAILAVYNRMLEDENDRKLESFLSTKKLFEERETEKNNIIAALEHKIYELCGHPLATQSRPRWN